MPVWVDVEMKVTMFVPPGLTHQIPHAVETVLVGSLGWSIKYLGRSIRKEWQDVKDKLGVIEKTTVEQASNHLHTIEVNTAKTNALLEKVLANENMSKTNELLGKVLESQIELNGWLKGRLSRD